MIFLDPFGFDYQRPRDLVRQGDDEAAVSYINKFVEAGSVRALIAMADYLFDKGDEEANLAWMDRVERSVGDDDLSLIHLSNAYRRGLGRGTAFEQYKEGLCASGARSRIWECDRYPRDDEQLPARPERSAAGSRALHLLDQEGRRAWF